MRLNVLLRGIFLLVLAGYAREEDETCAVGLETLDIEGEGGGGEVGASVVD